ncbi:penicillin-binding protein 2 [Mesorhizobium sp. M2D.F.Ca.ET.185.01.1.1]|uniref:peptidoglycan D,D-transpeptidase FtsI family protein n=1 Tax=unclassified Mesorhizobium TaxID=325217 RepID=UPI000FCB952C|nr:MULTISPECIES: penicillin-binding protein 2 [unclassified Mesorhizobium]TGP80423.1 penicillin-binding protein 2 [bacterium M00.F.Ca.ET.227.01.1.1]TGQ00608.1 penicillin-binding protein 2 [bacterium M00.F.Ca.ET.221.01.1.1]TGQ02870.1 penicillin-binding protein 2 [bacterium M00.F.Ca.ET.222.01.1.1]TGT74452.1 penicillin-binding protein 2 [bacterium M00.F.Ca.ET.159.01.1.1]TGT86702.1 penicillin-binding protein 2 [bacterium M00.F.Ca.ET.157.01.1.1]TGU09261.1 penicillin-binding protein 2 [bacterium M0
MIGRLPRIGNLLKRRKKAAEDGSIVVDAARKATGGKAKTRIIMTMAVFFTIYSTIAGRLVYLGMQNPDLSGGPENRVTASRPDIVDRNGEVLATDIKTASLFAEPRRIVDADEAIEKLSSVLPEIDYEQTYRKLKSGAGFVWLQRQLTPKQQSDIMALGVPGLGFRTEKRRFYPSGETSSYIVGLTNIDNQGISGMEKYIDEQGLSDLQASGLAVAKDLKPVRLSIDLRVQHVVRDEIAAGLERYRALGAGAVVLNIKTGEVMAMASVPDFDPNNPYNAQEKDRLNRMSAGLYEMGSTFKSFTSAMALDSGKATMNSHFDASHPIRVGHQAIHDFHGKNRVLSLPEVFLYSSNIGSAREAELVGIEGHREFLHRLGILEKMQTELPEIARPTEPKVWKQVNSFTIAFGHGVSTTPLQAAVGCAALMQGFLIQPTFLVRSEQDAMAVAKRVVSDKTVEGMRYLYTLNAEKGSARNARAPGYRVGGKTGTAEKVINGRYSKELNFNTFVAAFPMDDPQFLVFTIADAPHPEKPGMTDVAANNAGVIAGNIIRRSAAMLGVKPDFSHENGATLVSYQ